MEIGDSLRLSDLSVPEGATLLDDPETVLATVTVPTRVEEPEEEVEEVEEGEEGEAAEGEAAPEAEGEAPAGAEAAAGEAGSDEEG
jgi:large subunit ribosomal protein L25